MGFQLQISETTFAAVLASVLRSRACGDVALPSHCAIVAQQTQHNDSEPCNTAAQCTLFILNVRGGRLQPGGHQSILSRSRLKLASLFAGWLTARKGGEAAVETSSRRNAYAY